MVKIMISNRTIRIAVCDDIVEDRQEIVNLLLEYADINEYLVEIDEYVTGEEIIDSDLSKYSLVILDIFMDKINGIEAAKIIMDKNPKISIIFHSVSNDFAEESYDVNAYRYLTKPIEKDKLYQTLDKFFNYQMSLRMLTFKQNRMVESVYVSDILWIEASAHKSIIHLKYGDIITSTIFKQFCAELDDADFIKPIRFALVSLEAIDGIPGNEIKLVDGTVITISRDSRKMVRQAYIDYKMNSLSKKGDSL